MGKCKTILAVTLSLFLFSNNVGATHIFGGDLLYSHVSGNTYRITLTIYGDCTGGSFPGLVNSTPQIKILRGQAFFNTIVLTQTAASNVEVTPVCPEQIDSTACKIPNSKLPGVTRFIYSGLITLTPSANWKFIFEGDLGSNAQAGRSGKITNITFPNNGSIMYLEATLNNLNGPNSSPEYTTIPTPFYCINVDQEYNQGASDSDGDSLSFSLIPALITSTTNATYRPGYTGQDPLAVQLGSFNFNVLNGQMSFIPNIQQISVVVNKVEEYKNGILVGSSMREMTFVVINNCTNNPPTGSLDTSTLTGGRVDYADKNQINVCTGDRISFKAPSKDIDNDNINLTLNNIPTSSSVTVSNNNTNNPLINFDWNTQGVPIGNYSFFANYLDDACPLSSSQTIAYTIKVVNPYSISHEVLYPSNCYHKTYVKLNITNGVVPRIVTLSDANNNVLGTYIDSTGDGITDSLNVGTYNVKVTSDYLLCGATYQFTLVDSGVYPITPEVDDINTCINEEPLEITIKNKMDGMVMWYTTEGTLLANTPTYQTVSPNTYQWSVRQKFDTCYSEFENVTVIVHDLPIIKIDNRPQQVCKGDGMTLRATGGIKYEWAPASEVILVDSMPYTRVNQPTTYVVTGTDEFGCKNKDSVTYSDVKQCCLFSYPDAFTPNADGRNDGWRVLNYGNVESYLLSIYNRWGERVFLSSDPNKYWDGKFGGKKADVGTYYYYLKAKCVTGQKEEQQGSFILIR